MEERHQEGMEQGAGGKGGGMKKEEAKKPKKMPKKMLGMLSFILGGFGKDLKFMHWVDSAKGAIGDIGGKVGCRRSSHTRWKEARAKGYTEKRR